MTPKFIKSLKEAAAEDLLKISKRIRRQLICGTAGYVVSNGILLFGVSKYESGGMFIFGIDVVAIGLSGVAASTLAVSLAIGKQILFRGELYNRGIIK